MDIKALAQDAAPYVVERRHYYHQHPELTGEEKNTRDAIHRDLEALGITDIRDMVNCYGLVATIHGGKPGKTVGLRADTDALSFQEETGLPFASCEPGKMHACGHDTHIAMLLGAAKLLQEHREELRGDVRLIFQPAEEHVIGSKAMIAEGALDGVDAIFGQHVCPSENDTVGTLNLYKGYFTSAVDLFHITVHGKSGHGSAPHTARDAIACAGYLITVLQTVVSRRIDPMDTAVLTVGTMSGGDAVNITAGEARMVAVLRSFSDAGRDTAIQEVRRICKGIGIAFDCDIEVELEEGYALQYNDPAMIDLVNKAVTAASGKAEFIDKPFSGSEDFSFFGKLTGTPSAFMMVDAGRGENAVSLHNGKIVFNEEVMKHGVTGMAAIAMEYLNR